MLFLCKFALRNHHDNSPAMENESRKYWHLCSDELPDNLIFKTVEDFRQGMNSIPIALQGMNIIIFCFTLMNNHFHFLLSGKKAEAIRFFCKLKTRLGKCIQNSSHPLRRLKPVLVEITSPEMFKTEVAYILRNCLKARICDPYTYPWNTCRLYFRRNIFDAKPYRIEEMSRKQIKSDLSTCVDLPSEYLVANGYILPESYVNCRKVEELFASPVEFFLQLSNWKVEQESARYEMNENRAMYDDTTLMEKLNKDFEYYGVKGFDEMDVTMRRIFARLLRNKYGSDVKQICRICGLDSETVKRFGGWK